MTKIHGTQDPIPPQNKKKSLQARLEAFRFAFKLRTILILTLSALTLGVAGTFLAVSYKTLKANKTTDVLAIFFLELEQKAKIIHDLLIPAFDPADVIAPSGFQRRLPSMVLAHYELRADGSLRKIEGTDIRLDRLADLGVKSKRQLAQWNSLRKGKKRYMVFLSQEKEKNPILSFFAHPKDRAFEVEDVNEKSTIAYVATKQGDLIYSNYRELNQENFNERILVQRFIRSPLLNGQIEINDPITGFRSYGFYKEVPDTNIVVFAEASAISVEQTINAVMAKLFVQTFGIAVGTLIFAFLITSFLLKPLAEISLAALALADGHFDLDIKPTSFGEVRVLSRSLRLMIENLRNRDRRINELIAAQVKMAHLESELKISKLIQSSLLPQAEEVIEGKITQSAIYEPAEEVAGDWFNFQYFPEQDLFLLVIVDISGHGAGSSMFAAMAAAVFQETCFHFRTTDDVLYFFDALNRQLLTYGRHGWSASAQAVVIDFKASTADIFNCGHVEPLLDSGDPKPDFQKIRNLKSNILGILSEAVPARITKPFLPGDRLILYTDGLIERRNTRMNTFGVKRFINTLNRMPKRINAHKLKDIVSDADLFAEQQQRTDDICLVVLQRSQVA